MLQVFQKVESSHEALTMIFFIFLNNYQLPFFVTLLYQNEDFTF